MDLCKQMIDEKDVIYYNFEFIDDTFMMPMKQNDKDYLGLGNKEEEIPYNKDGSVKEAAQPYSQNRIQIYKEHPLMLMIKSENEDSRKLLDHDLVKTMLNYRWKTFGRFGYFWLSFFPYAAFLFFFTLMIINIDRKKPKINEKTRAIEIESVHVNVTFRDATEITQEVANNIIIDCVAIAFASILLIFLLVKEWYQFRQLTRKAYISWENWGNLGELFVYFLSVGTILWRTSALCSKDDLSDGFWILASFVFAISCFMMLIHKKEEFSQWDYSFFKTFMMSTGEIDYSDIFFDETDHFENRPGTKYFTMVIFFVFVFVIVILVHNLFTGVAVGNIEDIMKEAKLEELAIEADCLLMQATLSKNIMKSQKYRHCVSVNREDWTFKSEIVSFWKLHWEAVGTYFGRDLSCCSCCSCCSGSNENQTEADRRHQLPDDDKERRKKEANQLKKLQEDNFFLEDPIKKHVMNNEKMTLDLQKEVKELKTELTNQKEQMAIQNKKTGDQFTLIIDMLITQQKQMADESQKFEDQINKLMKKPQESHEPGKPDSEDEKENNNQAVESVMLPGMFEMKKPQESHEPGKPDSEDEVEEEKENSNQAVESVTLPGMFDDDLFEMKEPQESHEPGKPDSEDEVEEEKEKHFYSNQAVESRINEFPGMYEEPNDDLHEMPNERDMDEFF
ncbi:unnamed protein product, partial [Mesorhabditis belari]|uniref:Ion transport domain-containing protein n=1 Tax=Mesorhabditis belari TaxID=2138241 RepID=A0AAF3EHR0_9BILA